MKQSNNLLLSLIIIFCSASAFSQGLMDPKIVFTHADTLRGTLRDERTCYDVTFYDLTVKVNPETKFIEGSCTITYNVIEDFTRMQIDLFQVMKINKILFNNIELKYTREEAAVWVDFPDVQKNGTHGAITITYSGNPIIAKKAPWDGGFVFTKDKEEKTWIGVACEGMGASSWWPCKDHLSDEPDSMALNIIVPSGLKAIGNGSMRKVNDLGDGYTEFEWFISYPINTYNVTLNIGNYIYFNDSYQGVNGYLDLEYYVMPYNLEKAKKQFAQVKPMMECYEKFLSPYPFYKDGYALVETPYLGMEHQGAIAYGNGYKTGYAGMDFSGIGLDFDYIIIHETGHEWWGNNVSMADIADMWIHEGICTYSEIIYVECIHGYEIACDYAVAQRNGIGNEETLIGPYGVNKEGSGDMYPKGANLMHTLRHVLDNDDKWWQIVYGIQTDFAKQTVSTAQIENYISEKAGMNFSKIFDQYLRHAAIPVFEYKLKQKGKKLTLSYRWVADVADFNMRFKVTTSKDKMEFISPTTEWQSMSLTDMIAEDFKTDVRYFYVTIREVE